MHPSIPLNFMDIGHDIPMDGGDKAEIHEKTWIYCCESPKRQYFDASHEVSWIFLSMSHFSISAGLVH